MNFNHNLLLSASRKSWKMSSTHGTRHSREYEKKYKSIWDSIWKRDNYTCYFCNFHSKDFQEIHHLNDDHEDNSKDNLVTICPLCHQCFHLDTVSLTNGGKIIWLPEFSQQELNYISRAIFVAIEHAEQAEEKNEDAIGFTKIARMLENNLLERAIVVDQSFQAGASEPVVFANALINMSEATYQQRDKFLRPFRLLSLRSRFPVQTRYWKNKEFKNSPVENWEQLVINRLTNEQINEQID